MTMNKCFAGLLALTLMSCTLNADTVHPDSGLAVIDIRIDDLTLSTELADSDSARSVGLMHRESMPEYHSMLFVYPDTNTRCFWMRNTLIPLTVAFLDTDGTVLQLTDMEPQSTTSHCSNAPVRYALEVNQGWFERHDKGVGDRFENLPE